MAICVLSVHLYECKRTTIRVVRYYHFEESRRIGKNQDGSLLLLSLVIREVEHESQDKDKPFLLLALAM